MPGSSAGNDPGATRKTKVVTGADFCRGPGRFSRRSSARSGGDASHASDNDTGLLHFLDFFQQGFQLAGELDNARFGGHEQGFGLALFLAFEFLDFGSQGGNFGVLGGQGLGQLIDFGSLGINLPLVVCQFGEHLAVLAGAPIPV